MAEIGLDATDIDPTASLATPFRERDGHLVCLGNGPTNVFSGHPKEVYRAFARSPSYIAVTISDIDHCMLGIPSIISDTSRLLWRQWPRDLAPEFIVVNGHHPHIAPVRHPGDTLPSFTRFANTSSTNFSMIYEPMSGQIVVFNPPKDETGAYITGMDYHIEVFFVGSGPGAGQLSLDFAAT